ncbi:RNase H1/viroplasmin domain-containing protein [Clostridioides difficile]|nr:hypothetical protein KW95_14035 [Clostridioides difficile]
MTKKKAINKNITKKKNREKKYYAIKEGRGVENLIVRTWTECKELVHGYNSVYKSFANLEDANKYLKEVNVAKVKEQAKHQIENKKIIKQTTKHIEGFRISNEMYEDLEIRCREKGIKIEDAIKFAISRYVY